MPKISTLPNVAPLSGVEHIPIVQSGQNRKVQASAFALKGEGNRIPEADLPLSVVLKDEDGRVPESQMPLSVQELLTASSAPVLSPDRSVYLSVEGNDTTAEVGNPLKAYATGQAAMAAVLAISDTGSLPRYLIISPGAYTCTIPAPGVPAAKKLKICGVGSDYCQLTVTLARGCTHFEAAGNGRDQIAVIVNTENLDGVAGVDATAHSGHVLLNFTGAGSSGQYLQINRFVDTENVNAEIGVDIAPGASATQFADNVYDYLVWYGYVPTTQIVRVSPTQIRLNATNPEFGDSGQAGPSSITGMSVDVSNYIDAQDATPAGNGVHAPIVVLSRMRCQLSVAGGDQGANPVWGSIQTPEDPKAGDAANVTLRHCDVVSALVGPGRADSAYNDPAAVVGLCAVAITLYDCLVEGLFEFQALSNNYPPVDGPQVSLERVVTLTPMQIQSGGVSPWAWPYMLTMTVRYSNVSLGFTQGEVGLIAENSIIVAPDLSAYEGSTIKSCLLDMAQLPGGTVTQGTFWEGRQQHGLVDVPNGAESVVVTFPSPAPTLPRFVDANLRIPNVGGHIACAVDQITVTTNGFTVRLAAPTPNGGYKLNWTAFI